MVRKSEEKQFWLINKSMKRDVSLSDLRIKVKKASKINLLSKHYDFTLEELNKSAESGSIYKKRHLLAVREVAPTSLFQNMIIEEVKPRILKPLRNPKQDSSIPYYEELNVDDETLSMSDEQFALEQAEADLLDHAPSALAVDKKFAKKDDSEDE